MSYWQGKAVFAIHFDGALQFLKWACQVVVNHLKGEWFTVLQ